MAGSSIVSDEDSKWSIELWPGQLCRGHETIRQSACRNIKLIVLILFNVGSAALVEKHAARSA